jgi:hypothetical protein
MENVLKQRVTTKDNHKRYSTALGKTTSMMLSKHGENDGNAVYVPKETILKKMASKID